MAGSIYHFVREICLPPTFFIILLLAGLGLQCWRRRTGMMTIRLAALGLTVFGMPVTGWILSQPRLITEAGFQRPLTPDACQAIVVLGGGLNPAADPHDPFPLLSAPSLQRVGLGIRLAQESGLPLVLSGGRTTSSPLSEAEAMKAVIRDRLPPEQLWLEPSSLNTRENAEFTWRLLAPRTIRKICLVTDPLHMSRARNDFSSVGFVTVPAPTDVSSWDRAPLGAQDLLPSADGFVKTRRAVIEWLGDVAYRFAALKPTVFP